MKKHFKDLIQWFRTALANLLFWTVIGGLLTAFMLGAFRYAAHTSMFQFEKAEVRGGNFLTSDAIHDVLDNALDHTLFSVNISQLQANLSALEYVRSARVSRTFPSTLVVEIQERAPLAYLKCEDGRVVLDASDTLLHVIDGVRSHYSLPLVRGAFEEFSTERLIANPGVQEVCRAGSFLRTLQKDYPEYFRQLTEVSLNADTLALILDPGNTKLFLSRDRYQRQLQILETFENTVRGIRTLSDYATIDLRVRGQVVVREKR